MSCNMLLMSFNILEKLRSIRFEELFEVILKSSRVVYSNFFKSVRKSIRFVKKKIDFKIDHGQFLFNYVF